MVKELKQTLRKGICELKREIKELKNELCKKDKELERLYKEPEFLSRKEVLERDNYSCCICGEKETIFNVHHIRPKDLGGDDNVKNLMTLCKSCHLFMHCNPKLIMMEKIKHSKKTKEGIKKTINNNGKRGKDRNPRKKRSKYFLKRGEEIQQENLVELTPT